MHAQLLDPHGFTAASGIPLTDRGFRYGMSVFETIAVRDGAPLLLEPHLDKITAAVARVKFHPPGGWLTAARTALMAPPIREGAARLYVTAGDREGDPSRVALLFESLDVPAQPAPRRSCTVEFIAPTPFGKTGNYWPHFLALPASGEEALLVAPSGELLGAAMGNVFLVIRGELVTPAHPVRKGVVRDWILDRLLARELPLTREDLALATAAFITNSRLGVNPLSAIDGKELHGDSVVDAISSRYRTEVLRVG